MIVCMIGDYCRDSLALCLDSVKNVMDKLVFVWGGRDVHSLEVLKEWCAENKKSFFSDTSDEVYGGQDVVLLCSNWDDADKDMNGRARNMYLDFVKKYWLGEWCLVVDPDECLHDEKKLRGLLCEVSGKEWKGDCLVLDLHMRHLVDDLLHEDFSRKEHFVPARFFKISKSLFYPLGEHVVLQCDGVHERGQTREVLLWHFAYAYNLFRVLWRYKNNLLKSNIHSKEYLWNWYLAHVTGRYPVREFAPEELPECVIKHFCLEDLHDEAYFSRRMMLEHKHLEMSRQWSEWARNKALRNSVLDVGCGVGHYAYCFKCLGWDVYGFDKSKVAVKNCPYGIIRQCLGVCDLSVDSVSWMPSGFGLVLVLDVLEHLPYDRLDAALKNVYGAVHKDGYVLSSIPYLGDPNLELDDTHLVRESKDWWVSKIQSAGFVVEKVPDDWIFGSQLLLWRKRT